MQSWQLKYMSIYFAIWLPIRGLSVVVKIHQIPTDLCFINHWSIKLESDSTVISDWMFSDICIFDMGNYFCNLFSIFNLEIKMITFENSHILNMSWFDLIWCDMQNVRFHFISTLHKFSWIDLICWNENNSYLICFEMSVRRFGFDLKNHYYVHGNSKFHLR